MIQDRDSDRHSLDPFTMCNIFLAHFSHRLKVRFCDHWMSVITCVVNNCFKWLKQTWQECSVYPR